MAIRGTVREATRIYSTREKKRKMKDSDPVSIVSPEGGESRRYTGLIRIWLDAMSERERLDVTDRIQVYEKGKAWECDCGQGFGTKFNVSATVCPTCGVINEDSLFGQREEQSKEKYEKKGQTDLSQWT